MEKLFSFNKALDLLKNNEKIDKLLFKDNLHDEYDFSSEGVIMKGKQGNQIYFVSWKLGIKENELFNKLKVNFERQINAKTLAEYQEWKNVIKEILELVNLEKFGFQKIKSQEEQELDLLLESEISLEDKVPLAKNRNKKLLDCLSIEEIEELKAIINTEHSENHKVRIKYLLGTASYFTFPPSGIIYESPVKQNCWRYVREIRGELKEFEIEDFKIIREDKGQKRYSYGNQKLGLVCEHPDYGIFYISPAGGGIGWYSKNKNIKDFEIWENPGITNVTTSSYLQHFIIANLQDDTYRIILRHARGRGIPFCAKDIDSFSSRIQSSIFIVKPEKITGVSSKIDNLFIATEKDGIQRIYQAESSAKGDCKVLEFGDSITYENVSIKNFTFLKPWDHSTSFNVDFSLPLLACKNATNDYDYYFILGTGKGSGLDFQKPIKLIKIYSHIRKITLPKNYGFIGNYKHQIDVFDKNGEKVKEDGFWYTVMRNYPGIADKFKNPQN